MKKIHGFTILELMMTLAVAGVLLVVGIPSMQQFIKNNRLTSINNELVSALQLARSAAIKDAGVAYVCSSSTAGNASPSCSDSNNWEAGFIAFLDSSDDGEYNPASPENDVLLKVWDGTQVNNVTLRNDTAAVNSVDYVRFNSRGVPVTTVGGSLKGMFKVCDDRGLTDGSKTLGKGIIVSAPGSIRTTKNSATISACL